MYSQTGFFFLFYFLLTLSSSHCDKLASEPGELEVFTVLARHVCKVHIPGGGPHYMRPHMWGLGGAGRWGVTLPLSH